VCTGIVCNPLTTCILLKTNKRNQGVGIRVFLFPLSPIIVFIFLFFDKY
jgi:hypothetical protein